MPDMRAWLWVGTVLLGAACSSTPQQATWHKEVKPLVQEHCVSCHNSDGIAPFALETYEEARSHASGMARAVSEGQMPPWLPAEGCQSFQGERRLQQAEIDLFVAWKDSGAPEGNASESPGDSTPQLQGLPRVDKQLTFASPYTPNAAVGDDYRCFKLDPQLTADTDVIGLDIVPGVRKMVHHVLLYAMSAADADAEDNKEAGLGWTCYGGPGGSEPAMIGGWVPGSSATVYPSGTGIPVLAGQVLVMQIHYNTQNGSAPDQTQVNLMYAPTRAPKPAKFYPLAQTSFSIPPNAQGYSVTQEAPAWLLNLLPEKTIWAIIPHMHVKGRSLKVMMDNTCLVDIPRWDFHWQQAFMYSAPITRSSTSSIRLTCTWDNTTNNAVTWGEGTADEMCLNYFYMTQ